MIKHISSEIITRIEKRLNRLYGSEKTKSCMERLGALIGRYGVGGDNSPQCHRWDEQRVVLITYADIVKNEGEAPLKTLTTFANAHLKGSIDTIHILPFFPYSSDDGFSIIDHRQVGPDNGTWADVENLNQKFQLMFDLVLNHVSRKSAWFSNYISDIAPYSKYFIEVAPDADTSSVMRPRTSPLLTPVHKDFGEAYLWTTFSADQIDLNFANPDVLFEFLDILVLYIAKGANIIRLDAVAYLWKQLGTSCIHLEQTHEVIKLFRDLLEMIAPHVVILTETNVPHNENISYFGNSDEAHMIYQFSLPPLLLHALTTGSGKILSDWAKTVCEAPKDCTYFNFTASHDGIGVRPLSGIVPDKELTKLAKKVEELGGKVSYKANEDGSQSPYELNITYFDALGGDNLQAERFLCSQTIMLSLKGVPGIYFHSLIATPNDHEGVAKTGRARSINRKKWNISELESKLSEESVEAKVFDEYRRRIQIRTKHQAFHPDAQQAVIDLGTDFFAFTRKASSESVLCVNNLTPQEVELPLSDDTPLLSSAKPCIDLLGNKRFDGVKKKIVLAPFQTVWISEE